MFDLRGWALLVGLGLWGCTQAPAPCSDHPDCPPAARCVNGACVSLDPSLDAGVTVDGGLDAGDRRDIGPDPDGAVADAATIVDAQPGCAHLMFDARITNGAVEVRRDEPVEISVSVAEGATIEYASSAGGAFVGQPGGTLWIARDDVDWPWRTDRVTLTVTATLDACRLTRQLQVTLLGDVLLGDVLSGRLDVIGSNGTRFGQWRLVDQSGISAMASMPDGGFVVAIRGPLVGANYEPVILRLNANGEIIDRFDTEDLMGAPIFTRPIDHVYVRDGRVIAASGADDWIRWFDFDGALVRTVASGGRIEGMAPRGDTVAFSRNREARVFELRMDEAALIAEAQRGVYGLYPLRDDATLIVSDSSEDILSVLDAEGRNSPAPAPPLRSAVSALTHFDEGYLALSQSTGRVLEFDAQMAVVEDFEFAVTGADNPRAILWLHAD